MKTDIIKKIAAEKGIPVIDLKPIITPKEVMDQMLKGIPTSQN